MTPPTRKLTLHTFYIRVARGRGELPYHVHIVLPNADGSTNTEARNQQHVYLEDYMPVDTNHHAALGQFMHHWEGVEANLQFLLAKISRSDSNVISIIASNMGVKQIIDSTQSLSTKCLDDNGISIVTSILERVSKLNSKRNVIVHGHWTLELMIFPWKEKVSAKVHLLREVDPSDKRLSEKIADLKNQKVRVRYTFTIKRILGATHDAVSICKDLASLAETIDSHFVAQGANKNA